MKKAILASALAALMLLSACGEKKQEQEGVSNDVLLGVKQYVEDGLSEDAEAFTSSVSVVQSNNELMVSVRTVAVGGSYIPIVAAEVVSLVYEKADADGLAVHSVTVNERSKSNSGETENLISWQTRDGETGTYANDTGDAPVVENDVTLDELAKMFE